MAKLLAFREPSKSLPAYRPRLLEGLARIPDAYPLRDAAPRILAAIRALPEVRR